MSALRWEVWRRVRRAGAVGDRGGGRRRGRWRVRRAVCGIVGCERRVSKSTLAVLFESV